MCPEPLKGVKSFHFTAVANIRWNVDPTFTKIAPTSDSSIETEEQLRLLLKKIKSSTTTLSNTNKCHGVIQPIVNGVLYQISIPYEKGRGKNKSTHQQLYNGSHDLAHGSLKTYLKDKIRDSEGRRRGQMGELGDAIYVYSNLSAEDKTKLGPIKIRKLHFLFPKNSYDFLGLKLLEKDSIDDLKDNLPHNDICLNMISPVRTDEEFTAAAAAIHAKRDAKKFRVSKASSMKKQAKHNQLTVEERTYVDANGHEYVTKTSRKLTSPVETAMIKSAIKEINKLPNKKERTFSNVAKHITEISRKRSLEDEEEVGVAKEYVRRVFVGSGNLTNPAKSVNGARISSFASTKRKKAKNEKEKENWTMNKK